LYGKTDGVQATLSRIRHPVAMMVNRVIDEPFLNW
jgi:hypothetical protein